MKKSITFLVMISVLVMSACKSKNKDTADQESGASSSSASPDSKPGLNNSPKQYEVKFSPDSAILGKEQEALVKISGGKAVSLQDPDGKDNGVELTISLNLTNKRAIGGNSIHVDYPDSRLQLDNGTNITCETGTDFLRAEAEATSKTEKWVYKIPAGSKPVALNLFMDQTRVSVKVNLD